MKPVGKPDALIGHVRFDERGWETGRRSVRQCSRPSSTLQTGPHPGAPGGLRGHRLTPPGRAANSDCGCLSARAHCCLVPGMGPGPFGETGDRVEGISGMAIEMRGTVTWIVT